VSEQKSSTSTTNQEIEILLKEYESLRAEIISRLEAQTQLTSVATVLMGGILTAVPILLSFGPQKQLLNILPGTIIIILLIISTLFISILWTYEEHDIEMAYIGQYFNKKIRPRMVYLLKLEDSEAIILGWDRDRLTKMALIQKKPSNFLTVTFSVTLLSTSRYMLISIPILFSIVSAVLVYSYNYTVLSNIFINLFDIFLFILNLIYFSFAILYALQIRNTYEAILQ